MTNTALKPITSLRQLRKCADVDPRYADLIVRAAMNLGGWQIDSVDKAYNWLILNAMETDSEDGVVAEVNFCI